MPESGDGLRGGGVGEVAVPGLDSLLRGPGALGVFLQEFLIVVRLDQECVDPAERLDDERCGMAEVGEEPEGAT